LGNVMSYYYNCSNPPAPQHFSAQQIQIMNATLNKAPRSALVGAPLAPGCGFSANACTRLVNAACVNPDPNTDVLMLELQVGAEWTIVEHEAEGLLVGPGGGTYRACLGNSIGYACGSATQVTMPSPSCGGVRPVSRCTIAGRQETHHACSRHGQASGGVSALRCLQT
jgi:hypothetical protein